MLNRLTAVFLIFAQTVLGEETPNLRGRPENSLELESSTPANEAHNPKSSEEFMNKIFHNLKSKLRSEEANNAAGKSELSVNPQFTYGGYLIVRQRSYANKWNECSGPVHSLVARSLACERTGESRSFQASCYTIGSTVYVEMTEYFNHNCTGSSNLHSSWSQTGCSYGYGLQCVEHDKIPAFTEKGALVTYKFRHANDCYDFASTYLGIYPYRTDDHPDGDDYFFDYDYSDDYYEDCCFQYSIDEGCPLPLCGEGQTEPQYHRRLSADASSTAHDAPDQVLQLKTVKWWETDAFKAKLAARASKKAATPAAAASTATTEAHTAAATSTTSSSSSDADKTVQSAKQVLAYPYRESSLVQIRNGACLYEEKYDLWYKQTCHGGRQTMTYTTFVDDQCTRAIKRTEHNIWNAVPRYESCVVLGDGNGRTTLTVCQDEVKQGSKDINDPPPMLIA